MPSEVSHDQVMSPSTPPVSSPLPLSDLQSYSHLPRGLDNVEIPSPLKDILIMVGKNDNIEARFARLEEFMNQPT